MPGNELMYRGVKLRNRHSVAQHGAAPRRRFSQPNDTLQPPAMHVKGGLFVRHEAIALESAWRHIRIMPYILVVNENIK